MNSGSSADSNSINNMPIDDAGPSSIQNYE